MSPISPQCVLLSANCYPVITSLQAAIIPVTAFSVSSIFSSTAHENYFNCPFVDVKFRHRVRRTCSHRDILLQPNSARLFYYSTRCCSSKIIIDPTRQLISSACSPEQATTALIESLPGGYPHCVPSLNHYYMSRIQENQYTCSI